MHRRMFVTPSERRFMSSRRRTPSGSNDPASTMSAPHPDTVGDDEQTVLAFELSTGRWVLAKKGGGSGEWITAAQAVAADERR